MAALGTMPIETYSANNREVRGLSERARSGPRRPSGLARPGQTQMCQAVPATLSTVTVPSARLVT
jgi:hypothetical protein